MKYTHLFLLLNVLFFSLLTQATAGDMFSYTENLQILTMDNHARTMKSVIVHPDNLETEISSGSLSGVPEIDVEKGIKAAIEEDIVYYSGCSSTEVSNEIIEPHMLKLLDRLNLSLFTSVERLELLEGVIKSGSFEAVKKFMERMQMDYNLELLNHSSIMTPHYGYDRPLFWLAAIVTRHNLERVPEESYKKIEEYLCPILCPEGIAEVNSVLKTRQQYIQDINDWKQTWNNELRKTLGYDRYQFTK